MEKKNTDIRTQSEILLWKIPQVSATTNLSRTTIYELIRTGQLETVKIGKSIRITNVGLVRFIDSLRRL